MTLAFKAYENGIHWATYKCASCEQFVLVKSRIGASKDKWLGVDVDAIYPAAERIEDELPERAKQYLSQASKSLHAPDGAMMLAGAAIDAMLKHKNLEEGSVYSRIKDAVQAGILTQDMADWAHEVRLGSNKPRHADLNDPHVTRKEAAQAVHFAKMLGHILFTLPSRVAKGKQEAMVGVEKTN
ncbi:DUF4145 domain-containing protein [Sulfitobacter sp. DSM 110093]|uniref:DUF4145 domain-containing protein n=1 Tax=Sulfitobacter sp. DSM 110093 TaxID=2883127 RepID=UPI001FAE5230|nr:DUF4145 domain-containing protein [Sulfitobacter sp. DSM 110093]